jgi:hypothetical protein
MDLNLQITVSDKSIGSALRIVYAFPTYTFSYNAENNTLEAIIHVAKNFTPEQWAIIESTPYTITFVKAEEKKNA